MTSRSGTLIAPPSWGRAHHSEPEAAPRRLRPARVPVRWGIRARPGADAAAGAALLAATAGLWAAFVLAAW